MKYQNSTETDSSSFSEFKKAEKKYRIYQKKTTDFSKLIDLNKYDASMENICKRSELIDQASGKKYELYTFNFPEGCYVIKDFLTIEEQILLTKKCINDYHKKPNRTNLYIYDSDFLKDGQPLQSYDLNIYLEKDPKKFYFNTKIRWSNLGFQYDWNDRIYPSGQTGIPDELAKYPLKVLELMDYKGYIPECTIVNYYGEKHYMGGHLDDGEIDQESPIISFSIGLSCVFLIGGKTKDIVPHAIKLDSGDVLIMSKESRICFHGVPRILDKSFDSEKFMEYLKQNKPEVIEEHNAGVQVEKDGSFVNDDVHVVNYLKENRVNFNFRQVYPKEAEEKATTSAE